MKHSKTILIAFPVKKKKTPIEFQTIYLQRWRENLRFSVAVALGVFLVFVVGLLLLVHFYKPDSVSAALWKIFLFAAFSSISAFMVFYEPKPRKNEGEITREILDKCKR